MAPDAALDQFAFLVGLRLMGPDACRRLRIALLRNPDVVAPTSGVLDRIERLDALLDGRRSPESLQDRLDVAQAERERIAPPFAAVFWLARTGELIAAGFEPEQAARLVGEVRGRVDPAHCAHPAIIQEETA